jgi:hypothetical protein
MWAALRSSAALAATVALTFLLLASAAADWTPITPVPAGCGDDGFKVIRVDADTVRVAAPIIADWQMGAFRLDGVTRRWHAVRQVVDKPECQGFRARIYVPWDGHRTLRYRWWDVDGGWLESGTVRVR